MVNINGLEQLALQICKKIVDVREEMCLKISEHKILKYSVPTQTEHMLFTHSDPQAVE